MTREALAKSANSKSSSKWYDFSNIGLVLLWVILIVLSLTFAAYAVRQWWPIGSVAAAVPPQAPVVERVTERVIEHVPARTYREKTPQELEADEQVRRYLDQQEQKKPDAQPAPEGAKPSPGSFRSQQQPKATWAMEEVVEEERVQQTVVQQTAYVDTSLQAPSVITTYEDPPAYAYRYQPIGWSNNVVIAAGFGFGHGGRSFFTHRPPVRYDPCPPRRSLGYRNGGYAPPAYAHNNSTVQPKPPNTFNGGHQGGGGRRGHR